MTLTPVQQRFILHWGEMGTRWGINRTVAQIHALLFLSPKALTAEEIAETLEVARSNVSTSLRELQSWGIVKIVHVLGDRRDHFESIKDVWEMFRLILDERKARECDPTLETLAILVEQAPGKSSDDAYVKQRLTDMHQFFELMSDWYDKTRKMPTGAVVKFVKLGDKVARFFGVDE